MKKEQSLVWGKVTFFLSALLLSQAFLSSAFASFDGRSSSPACSACHSSGATTVMILGPTEVVAHSTTTYTLEISGLGPGVTGGLNVEAPDGGILSLVAGEPTRLTGDEITHTVPKAFAIGTVSWLFDWTAPETLGPYDLIGQGVSSNNDNETDFDFAGMTTFTVDVMAVPIPAAGILFGSALGLLGWLRRRAT